MAQNLHSPAWRGSAVGPTASVHRCEYPRRTCNSGPCGAIQTGPLIGQMSSLGNPAQRPATYAGVGLACARARVGPQREGESAGEPPLTRANSRGVVRDKDRATSVGHWTNPPSHSAAQVRCVGQCVGGAESERQIRYEIVKAGTPWTRGGGEGQKGFG